MLTITLTSGSSIAIKCMPYEVTEAVMEYRISGFTIDSYSYEKVV